MESSEFFKFGEWCLHVDESMGLIPNLEFMRTNTKPHTQVLSMLILPHIKSVVGLLKPNFVACPSRVGGPS